MTVDEALENLRKQLESYSDAKYADFALALLPGLQRRLLGVRLPRLRQLAKQWVKERPADDIAALFHPETFEETLFLGFVIAYTPLSFPEQWQLILRFVPLIDNWSVCDSCCASFTSVRQHRSAVWQDLMACLQSEEEYRQRFAVVLLLEHFLTEEAIDDVLQAIRTINPHGYYVEMAVGWALSEAALKFPESTLALLEEGCLPLACRKKACQKILESLRTPNDLRAQIRTLKSKL